jgi:tetratricopeptide (TPR) repeat protein
VSSLTLADPAEVAKLAGPAGGTEQSEPLGSIFTGDKIPQLVEAPNNAANPIADLFGTAVAVKTQSIRIRDPIPTGIVLRAVQGPSDAILIHDPEFTRLLRSTTFPWMAPYGNPPTRLEEPKDLEVPDFPSISGVIRGSTVFEIVVDGITALKGQVPDGTNLYLDFRPKQLREHLRLAWPDPANELLSEIMRDWKERPNAALTAGDEPIGWPYATYVPAADGLLAAFFEFNAGVQANTEELKGDYEKSLRLRTVDYHLRRIRSGSASVEAIRARANLAIPLSNLGQLELAVRFREDAVKAFTQIATAPNVDLVEQLLLLSTLYQQQGDIARAIISARQALALASRLPYGASEAGVPVRHDQQTEVIDRTLALALKDLPHGAVRTATQQLANLYNSAEDYDRAYVYQQRLAAFDFFDNPDNEANGDVGCYLKIADLALRQGRQEVSWAAASFVFYKAKAEAGQRDKPEPIQGPLTMPEGFDQVFGPTDRSSLISRALMGLGDAYWLARQPLHSAELAYEAALKSGLGSVGNGTDLTMTAAARLAMVRWLVGKDDKNLDLLKSAGAFDINSSRFSSWTGIDRDTQNIFASAYLGTLDWYAKNHLIDEAQRAQEAGALFAAAEEEMFGRAFQMGLLKRRSTTAAQLSAVKQWVDAQTDFDQAVRRLYSAVDRTAVVSPERVSQDRASSETARDRLRVAEKVVAQAFSKLLIAPSGSRLIQEVQNILQADEAAVSLLATHYAVYALVITHDEVSLNYHAINNTEVISRIRKMRAALDPQIVASHARAASAAMLSMIDTSALLDVAPFTLDLFGAGALSKRRWIVVTHDILRNIPLEAVPLSRDISNDPRDVAKHAELWPGLSKEIAYLPSLSALIDLRSDYPGSRNARVVTVIADPILPGDPRYESAVADRMGQLNESIRRATWSLRPGHWLGGSQLPPVPETAEIGYSVMGTLGGNLEMLYTGRRAKRSLLQASRAMQESRVLVFATHGETAESYPAFGEPFLVLTKESYTGTEPFDAFTASDIARLDLDAELVMLVACNTAAPDGTPGRSGFSGLAQSFLQSGARSLVVTQWRVLTRPAYSATIETLESAAKLGARPAEALRRGRFLVSKTFGHPSYWSGFVYVGDPDRRWKLGL